MAALWTLRAIFFACLCLMTLEAVLSDNPQNGGHYRKRRSFDTTKIGFTEQEKIDVVQWHNGLRRDVSTPASNMQSLVWADYLEVVAQEWSTTCLTTYNSANTYGEIYIYSSDEFFPVDILDRVIDPGIYNRTTDRCLEPTCREYLQVISAEARYVGCGLSYCDETTEMMQNSYMIICNYDPGFPKGSDPVPYDMGTPCSACPAAYPLCQDSLCHSDPICDGLVCENGGVLISGACMCNCTGTGYTNRTCSVSVGGGPVVGGPGWSSDTSKVALTEEEKIALILTHNNLRRQLSPAAANMPHLIWDDNLATDAQQWSAGCDFLDNSGNTYGENLIVQNDFYNVTNMVLEWYSEGASYDISTHTCTASTCDNYHQTVSSETRHFGCGMTFCPSMSTVPSSNAYFLVCNYDPAYSGGSTVPYESGTSCANCPAAYPLCGDSLCRSDPICDGLTCNNGGVLDEELCMCDCTGTGHSQPTCGEAVIGVGWSEDTSKVALTDEEKIALILTHNELRRQLSPSATNMPHLMWSDNLATDAQQWSAGCDFLDNSGNTYGENLIVQTDYYNVTNMVLEWYSEGASYDISTHTCTASTCDNYHQVVSAETRSFGCGMTYCPSMTTVVSTNAYYLVCNYDPPYSGGSTVPYESGTSCANCPAAYPLCGDSLCRSDPICDGLTCNNGGVLSELVCLCDCTGTGHSQPTCGEAAGGGTNPGNLNNGADISVLMTSHYRNAMVALATALSLHHIFMYIF